MIMGHYLKMTAMMNDLKAYRSSKFKFKLIVILPMCNVLDTLLEGCVNISRGIVIEYHLENKKKKDLKWRDITFITHIIHKCL